jgi:hypothetical protein
MGSQATVTLFDFIASGTTVIHSTNPKDYTMNSHNANFVNALSGEHGQAMQQQALTCAGSNLSFALKLSIFKRAKQDGNDTDRQAQAAQTAELLGFEAPKAIDPVAVARGFAAALVLVQDFATKTDERGRRPDLAYVLPYFPLPQAMWDSDRDYRESRNLKDLQATATQLGVSLDTEQMAAKLTEARQSSNTWAGSIVSEWTAFIKQQVRELKATDTTELHDLVIDAFDAANRDPAVELTASCTARMNAKRDAFTKGEKNPDGTTKRIAVDEAMLAWSNRKYL